MKVENSSPQRDWWLISFRFCRFNHKYWMFSLSFLICWGTILWWGCGGDPWGKFHKIQGDIDNGRTVSWGVRVAGRRWWGLPATSSGCLQPERESEDPEPELRWVTLSKWVPWGHREKYKNLTKKKKSLRGLTVGCLSQYQNDWMIQRNGSLSGA